MHAAWSNRQMNKRFYTFVTLAIAAWNLCGCDLSSTTDQAQQDLANPSPTAPAEELSAPADDKTADDPAAHDLTRHSSSPTIRWEFKADEAFESTPAVADGRVIIADVMGKVYAINLADGNQLWKVDFDTGFLASPLIVAGAVMIGDVDGFLYCLDVETGKEKWRVETGGEINGSAAVYKENVLVASQDGILYCFKQSDGTLVWKYETEDQIRCSPNVVGDRTFLGGCDGRLHMVDLTTGQAAGEPLPLDGPTGSTPAVAGSTVVVPIMDGIIYAFDWQQQTALWTHQDDERPQEYRNSPAVAAEMVILSSQFKQVDALSLSTGKPLWRHTLRRRADASPVIDGNDVWIAATDGRLIRLDLKTGQPTGWEFESSGEFYAAPIIVDNQLLIADDNGVLRCFTEINNQPK